MKATRSEVQKYLKALEETSQRIEVATKKCNDERLQFKADQKAWSVNDILAHLRLCADVWTHSIYAMLAENEPEFSDVNERKWQRSRGMLKYLWLSHFNHIVSNAKIYCAF